jgi:hypothetical protein
MTFFGSAKNRIIALLVVRSVCVGTTMLMAKRRNTQRQEPPPEEKWVGRTVRMPQSVWDAIDRDAALNRRSANQHLLWLVEQSLKRRAEN